MKNLIIVLALLCAFQGYAQTESGRKVGCIEGEIGAGLVFGADKLDFDKNRVGATFYSEIRYNMPRLPIDVGVHVGGAIFHRGADQAGELKFKTWNIMAVSDYNFFRSKKVSFFAGLGVGYASLDNSAPITFDNSSPNWAGFSTGTKTGSFCFMPRVGVELFHHLRFTFDYKFEEKANRHFDLTVGVVFGGGTRK